MHNFSFIALRALEWRDTLTELYTAQSSVQSLLYLYTFSASLERKTYFFLYVFSSNRI